MRFVFNLFCFSMVLSFTAQAQYSMPSQLKCQADKASTFSLDASVLLPGSGYANRPSVILVESIMAGRQFFGNGAPLMADRTIFSQYTEGDSQSLTFSINHSREGIIGKVRLLWSPEFAVGFVSLFADGREIPFSCTVSKL